MNTKGQVIIPPKYLRADSFSEGLAVVSNTIQNEFKDRRNYGYIDKDENLVIPFLFDQAFHFSGGLAAVGLDGKCGYINKSGEFMIPNIYRYCNSFSEDLDYEVYASNYFNLLHDLEDLLKKQVDLVAEKTLKNPFLIESINESKIQLI